MKFLTAFLVSTGLALGQSKPAAPPPNPLLEEQTALNKALADSGGSGVDFIRALEEHLKKYPNSPQKGNIERAIVKAAIEAKDEKRIIEYGERVLAAEPGDLQILDKVTRTLLLSDDRAAAEKALAHATRYQQEIEKLSGKPQGHYSAGQWQEEISKGMGRSYVYEARATGNLGKVEEALALAQRAWDAYPSAAAARELGRWYSRQGKNMEAVDHFADAFTLEDPASTEVDRAQDRVKMGELYQKANGSEKGLGDLILAAYDRTSALMGKRIASLRKADPNLAAAKIMEFTLPALEGSPLALSSLHGKTVIFDFWATWCGPCRVQHPLYEKVKEHFKNNPDVVFLSVATDEEHNLVAPFLTDHQWSKKVYFDAGLTQKFEISSIPTTIIVDKSGNIASRMNGFVPERFVDLLTDRINQALKN